MPQSCILSPDTVINTFTQCPFTPRPRNCIHLDMDRAVLQSGFKVWHLLFNGNSIGGACCLLAGMLPAHTPPAHCHLGEGETSIWVKSDSCFVLVSHINITDQWLFFMALVSLSLSIVCHWMSRCYELSDHTQGLFIALQGLAVQIVAPATT